MGLLHVAVAAILLQSTVQAQSYCSNDQSYKALFSAIENNPCLPDSQVWHLLNGIGHTSCKHLAAQRMYDKFRHFDVSQCGCTGHYSSWHFSSSLDDHCERHFQRLLNHYARAQHHNCNSHLFLWRDLQLIPIGNDGQYDRACLSDLTNTLDTTMRSSRNNCHCMKTGHTGQSGQQTEISDPPTTGAPVSTMFITKSAYAGCNDHTANGKITELLNGLNRSPCMADTQVWDLIYNIRRPECRHAAAEIVHDNLHNFNRDQCECSGSYTQWPLHSYEYESDHCDRHFGSLLTHYKALHQHCRSHLFIWNNLRQIPVDGNGQYNYVCIYHLALEIKNAMHLSTNTCQCRKKTIVTTDATVATTQPTPDPPTTGAPVSTMFITKSVYAGCRDHTPNGKITELLNGLNSNPCMADTQVWDLIYNIRSQTCRHAAAEIVYDKLHNFNSDQCECSGSFTHWPLHSYKYQSEHCDTHFGTLLTHYKTSNLQCHNNLFIWKDLRQIPVNHDGQYNYDCIYHLAEEIKNAMHSSTNTCQCGKKAIVTTDATVATTQPTPVPTVAQTTAATCDPVKTLAGVAHNTVVGQTSKCLDGIHSPAIYFVQSACSLNYQLSDLSPGQKMKDVCQTLPNYTAVARFVGNVLDTSETNRDAGIFIGCGTDHFKVVTENCTTKLHVEHILFTDPKADSYYVINHP